MYGLYRAWFGGGGGAAGSNNYPCLQDTFSPPDTVVRVGNEGEHQFVAHKGVLAAHSGYLKALLASAAATTTAVSTDGGSSASASCSPFDPTCATVAAVTIGQPQRSQPPVTSVSVSSVGGEAFAPLLNYMYTGRLEVTLDNVYSVLLATHLLHMPGALEQCRAALLRLRGPPALPIPPVSASSATTSSPGAAAPGSILRPIPSRLLVGPPLCWPPTTSLYPPPAAPPASVPISHLPRMPPSVLMQQPTAVPPSSISVVAPREKREQCVHYSASEVSRSPQSSPTHLATHHKRRRTTTASATRSGTPEIVSTVALPFVAAAAAAFTAFAVTSGASNSTTRGASSSPSRSVSPDATSSTSRAHSPAIITARKSTAISDSRRGREIAEIAVSGGSSCNDQPQRRTSADDESSRSRGSNTNTNNNHNSSSNGDATSERDRGRSSRRRARSGTANGAKESTASSSSNTVFSVIYDIACCDGPVRFHRVLNENYSSVAAYGGAVQTRGGMPRGCQLENDDLSSENDENGGPAPAPAPATTTATTATRGGGGGLARSPSESSNDGSNAGTSGSCYTCGYCKHTFKSQYCYRKHAKRHLLPTRVNETTTAGGGAGAAGAGGAGPRQDVAARGVAAGRREVRLLDLNVQYYPCKICGCKFPSYYFVHKHRKLCHANDEERLATEGNIEANATPSDRDVSASSPDRDVP